MELASLVKQYSGISCIIVTVFCSNFHQCIPIFFSSGQTDFLYRPSSLLQSKYVRLRLSAYQSPHTDAALLYPLILKNRKRLQRISLAWGAKQTWDYSPQTKVPFTEAVWSRNRVHIFYSMVMCKYVTCGKSWYRMNCDSLRSVLLKTERRFSSTKAELTIKTPLIFTSLMWVTPFASRQFNNFI